MIKLKKLVENLPMEADEESEFKRGFLLGRKDYVQKYERDLDPDHLPPAFVKGYKKGWRAERKKRWWDEMNARMTDLLGRMGSSRLR